MNKDTILEILNSESETLMVSDVQNILDEELNKSEEEMDLELIELCLDALESAQAKGGNGKRVRMKITKVLIAAVIFVLLVALTIPVCAKYFNINVPNGIVEFYGDHFDVDISGNEYVDDILVELEKNGVKDAVLPKIVFEKETKLFNFSSMSQDGNTTYIFNLENKSIEGRIGIQKYNSEYHFQSIQDKRVFDYSQIEMISVNNVEVIIYYNNTKSYIEYTFNNTEYNISLNCDFETAYQIAQTI